MRHNHGIRRAARRNYTPADTRQPTEGRSSRGVTERQVLLGCSPLSNSVPRIQCYRRVVCSAILDLKPFYPYKRVPYGLSRTLDPLFVTHPAGIRARP